MITPRATRLLRVPDLAAFRSTLTAIAGGLSIAEAHATFVLVPTRAAAEQLRRTIEDCLLSAARPALAFPILGTRADLYETLSARLPHPPRLASAFEREVLVSAIARGLVEEGILPPFDLRPGLVAEMLALYDAIRRLGKSVADFDRNFREELEKDRDTDRGAEKLLQQTVFLSALYQQYEARMAEIELADEPRLRDLLLQQQGSLRRLVVTVADRIADPDGLWPADFELITRLPQLEAIDIVATEAMLGAGLLERLYAALPELHEERAGELSATPVLVAPVQRGPAPAPHAAFSYRDREEELSGVARRLKHERTAPLHRTALVVRRPLPYLYLARDVFSSAGIPFETLDTLPLAAEPYAAAVDLALDAVTSDFTRASVMALLRSPHFACAGPAPQASALPDESAMPLSPLSASRAALDHALSEARYLGGLDRLVHLAQAWSQIDVPASREDRRRKMAAPAALAAAAALVDLAPLAETRPLPVQIETLLAWLRRYDRAPAAGDPTASRRLRVQAAVLGALTSLAEAYRAHDPAAPGDAAILSAAIRRWLATQTFAVSTGEAGLQIVDAQAARFGQFDDVQLVGLVDGEWPERVRRNVLYPSSLLNLLEPAPLHPDPAAREREALNAARAAFKDLLLLARRHVRVSTFVLENDAVVEPSLLLDQLEDIPMTRPAADEPPLRVFQSEALALDPRRPDAVPPGARAWAAARLDPAPDRGRFQGDAGAWTMPRVSVSRLERYLDCPFRFFASEVLRLEEQPEDEDTRTPLERGRFLHELFERFFSEWQKRGQSRIDAASVPEARALFTAICEETLAALPPSEASLERTRLLGSAVNAGIAHRVFAMEAERGIDVIERLLEFPLQGEFRFRSRDGRERTVTLSAKTDRIDLLADGTLRVIDYKSKKTPDLKLALQLPIYSHCARVSLDRHQGRSWTLREALYVSFEGERPVVPFNRPKGPPIDELIEEAQDRLLATLDRIAGGRFPPQPAKKSICGPCPYVSVCRLEYVEADDEPAAP